MGVTIKGGLPPNVTIVGTGADPPIVGDIGTVNRTGQVANIASTNLTNTRPAGVYFIRGVIECTVIGTGTLTLSVTYTDDVASSTPTLGTIVMTATGRTSANVSLYVASGDITYAVSGYVSGTYALRLRCFYGG
jgi:hypothetical protein